MAIVTITGENDFARSAAVRQLTDAFVLEHSDIALERLDGEEVEFVRIQEALTSLPFLANKKMVVLRHPSANKQFAEAAKGLLAGLPETTELILLETKFDKRSSLYKLLKKMTDFRDFGALDAPRLANWLVGEAKVRGATLSPADARYLVERVGQSQQLLSGELDKLRLFDNTISRRSIELLSEATPQSTIFQLIETAFAGNAKRAMAVYDEQRRLKVEPQNIVGMFAWQLHVLAVIKTAGERSNSQIASTAKLNPYVADKSARLADHMTLARLRQLIDRLVDIDARSKRENIDLDDALRLFVIELAN